MQQNEIDFQISKGTIVDIVVPEEPIILFNDGTYSLKFLVLLKSDDATTYSVKNYHLKASTQEPFCEQLEIVHLDSLKITEGTPKFIKFLTHNLIATDSELISFDLENGKTKKELDFSESQTRVELLTLNQNKLEILAGAELYVSDTDGAVSATLVNNEQAFNSKHKSLTSETIEVQDVIQSILSNIEISNQYFHNDSKEILHLESNPGDQSLSIPVHIFNTNVFNHNMSFNIGHAFFDGN